MKKYSSLLILTGLNFFSFSQTDLQISNQKTFAKIFGYVRYFHPSDEASGIDWDRFAIYGCNMIDKCKSQQELKTTLNNLFVPIAPSLKVFETKENIWFNIADITPADKSKFRTIAWQHLGLGMENESIYNPYKSARTNRPFIKKGRANLLFEKYPVIGEYINKEIGSGLSCIMPLALYGDDRYTYPVSDPIKLNALKENIKSIPDSSVTGNDLYVRLADLIISWNIFQHFYPYFDIAKTNWSDDLSFALVDAYHDKSDVDFQSTLQKFTAKLKDGHVWVRCISIPQKNYFAPFNCDWVENKLVITGIFSDTLQIHKGDIITRIDGMDVDEYFKPVEEHISSATKGWMAFREKLEPLIGYNNSELNLTVNNKEGVVLNMSLKRTMFMDDYRNNLEGEKIKKIKNDIYYINITAVTDSSVNTLMPSLVQCKSIIFDLRGYPSIQPELISHLLTQKDTSKMWMRIPQVIYPDQKNLVDYKTLGWELKPESPHLNAKIIFIIDGSAISYSESIMSFIEYYKLATIIGQPTAGTNGNINPFTMPGGYRISWTGMKVVKHDGSQHHGIGIQPDIFITRTIKGVREGRDEFLEKAIELANK